MFETIFRFKENLLQKRKNFFKIADHPFLTNTNAKVIILNKKIN